MLVVINVRPNLLISTVFAVKLSKKITVIVVSKEQIFIY